MVLETVPAPLARMVAERIAAPVIGIGAGPDCDGQVQVLHDLLGLYDDRRQLRHAKRYAVLGEAVREAVRAYAAEVGDGAFPTEAESFPMTEETLGELRQAARA